MRTVRLARLAAEAEILLIRREIRAYTRRAAFGAVAAVFGLGVLVLLHVLGYLALRQYAQLSPFISVLIVFGVDVVIAAIFAMLASGVVKDPVAEEARHVRDQSLAQVKDTLTAAAILRPAGRYLGRKHVYGLVLAGLTARFLGSNRRA